MFSVVRTYQGIEFKAQPKGGLVKRFAQYKGHTIDLPEIKIPNFSLDKLQSVMESLMPLEAEMVKSLNLKSSEKAAVSAVKQEPKSAPAKQQAPKATPKPIQEHKAPIDSIHNHKDTDFQAVAFSGTNSYTGVLLGQGNRPDFRNRREDRKPSIRPAIEMQLDDGDLVRIFGASLPTCVASSGADTGDRIEIKLVKRGSAGKSNQYFIKKL